MYRALGLAGLTLVFLAALGNEAQAQGCNLTPRLDGGDDAIPINACLSAAPFQATLGPGTFRIFQPISIRVANASLVGAGRANTNIVAAFGCGQPGPVIDVNGQGPALVANVSVRGFYLDLTQLAPGCATDGASAIRYLRVNEDIVAGQGGEISGLTLQNGAAGLTGIEINKSAFVQVRNNRVRDFTTGSGILVYDSPAAVVDANRVNRADFGIIVRNFGGSGAAFDASRTQVTNNQLTGRFGRAMKLQASETNSVPLRDLVVTGNTATDFRTGLYLVASVIGARVENNHFDGGPSSIYALWIGSINPGQENAGLNASYNNQIRFNTFKVGGCDPSVSGCADVSFNGAPSGNNVAGPDQPTISRGDRGTNTLGFKGIEATPATRCAQYSHAWWAYPNGQYVPSGGRIYLAAAGTFPGSRVTYHVRNVGGSADLMTFTSAGTTNSVCVLNQELSPPIQLPAGLYDVAVDLLDGNARYPDANFSLGVPIRDWRQAIKLDVR